MDIEEDIKKLKELNNLLKFFKTHGWIPNLSRNTNINETIEAIEHILAEREEDKKEIEKLKEEVETHTYLIFTPIEEALKDYIPKQKVIEVVKEAIEIIKSEQFKVIMGDMTKVNRLKYLLKKELLEDK